MFKISDENMATMHNLSKEFDIDILIAYHESLRIHKDESTFIDWNRPYQSHVWFGGNEKYENEDRIKFIYSDEDLAEKLSNIRDRLEKFNREESSVEYNVENTIVDEAPVEYNLGW
jgi:hypothetical protein